MPKVKANGIEINYETRGNGNPLLFIHGSGTSWKMWKPQIDAFSNEYKMILIDMRGHGESTKEFPYDKYSINVIAEDVKNFLDELGLKRIPIIGLSQGAIVASLFATKHPQYVEKLILSSGYSEPPTKLLLWMMNISRYFFILLPFKIIISLIMMIYKNDEYIRKIVLDSISIDKKMLLSMMKTKFPNYTNELHKIASPTLILAGDKNIIVPEIKGAITLLEHIPNSKVVIFKGAFDPLSIMRRDLFNNIVMNFLKGNALKQFDSITYVNK